MSSEHPNQSKILTSQAGRQWLENANSPARSNSQSGGQGSPIVVVSIPELGDSLATIPGSLSSGNRGDREMAAGELARAAEIRIEQLSSALEERFESSPTIDTSLTGNQTATSDLPERVADWSEKPDLDDSDRSNEKSKTTSEQDAAITKFVDGILVRFPIAQPIVLLFVGSESNPHLDETCARVSSVLADRNVGRILLVDSDGVGQSLSRASGQFGSNGVSEVVNQSVPWRSVICESPNGIDFLPCGSQALNETQKKHGLREAVAEMKTVYQFICVAAGDAHSSSARVWGELCDGSYLLVSLKNSNETIAKSAIAELQSSGARLLGCVVTDA